MFNFTCHTVQRGRSGLSYPNRFKPKGQVEMGKHMGRCKKLGIKTMLDWIPFPLKSLGSMRFVQIYLSLEGCRGWGVSLGTDVLTNQRQTYSTYKNKKALCYIERKKETYWYCTSLKNKLPNTRYPFQKKVKGKQKGNKNVMYAFKWYFYGFLYNTTFSENIHLDINSSTNVQNL